MFGLINAKDLRKPMVIFENQKIDAEEVRLRFVETSEENTYTFYLAHQVRLTAWINKV